MTFSLFAGIGADPLLHQYILAFSTRGGGKFVYEDFQKFIKHRVRKNDLTTPRNRNDQTSKVPLSLPDVSLSTSKTVGSENRYEMAGLLEVLSGYMRKNSVSALNVLACVDGATGSESPDSPNSPHEGGHKGEKRIDIHGLAHTFALMG